MKPFELFRVGRHTSAGGTSLDFSDDHLRAAVEAYDPALHEAPIVVGHPRDNAPAYGWIKALSYADGTMTAEPVQVDEAFAEMVQAGRFKKRSASFYTPDAPNNPKPGTYYLRHVGFLGAQPPAVKGLRDVAFADGEAGIVEFSDDAMVTGILAMMMRRLREFFIAEYGSEKADSVVPDFLVADIEAAARRPPEPEETPAGAMPAFSEEDPMQIEQLKARVAELEQQNATLAANQQPADFAERQTALQAREAAVAERETQLARVAVEARVDAAVKAGRLLPAQRKHAVDFAMGLIDGEAAVEFGEGEQAKKVSQREAYLLQLETAPKVVDYTERAPAGDPPPENAGSVDQVVDKARAIVKAASDAGKHLSFTEAVAQATAELSGQA